MRPVFSTLPYCILTHAHSRAQTPQRRQPRSPRNSVTSVWDNVFLFISLLKKEENVGSLPPSSSVDLPFVRTSYSLCCAAGWEPCVSVSFALPSYCLFCLRSPPCALALHASFCILFAFVCVRSFGRFGLVVYRRVAFDHHQCWKLDKIGRRDRSYLFVCAEGSGPV